jgi:hypothetical protein
MHEIFPHDEVAAKFAVPLTLRQYGMTELTKAVKYASDSLADLALNVWNRAVQVHKLPVDPSALGRYYNPMTGRWNLLMLSTMEKLFGKPVLRDISFSRCRVADESLADRWVSRLYLGHVFPNDLHIADILFRDPYQPLPEAERRYRFQSHKGLGMLGKTIERIEQYARKQGCDSITLTAATPEHVPLFGKYGFTVEENEGGQMQRAMEKKLA